MAILFDFDEVIVDINTNALNYINNKLKTKYSIEDLKTWDFFDQESIRPVFMEFLLKPDLYQTLAIPNKKMIELIKQLIESGEKVYIVTASVEGSHESKEKFIRENMSFFDINNVFVINTSSKYKVKSQVLNDLQLNYHEPIVLVDDGVHNVLDMMADLRHKDKLDDMMKKLYTKKKLSHFNNPYHDFVYGIIPELPYNKAINDGKRIFKIKETGELWKVLKFIRSNHSSRIAKKQNEIFFYFNELINIYLEEENKKSNEKNKIIQNTKYLVDYYLSEYEHKSFLNKLLEVYLKTKDLSEEKIEKLFKMTEKIFSQDIMYQEIKALLKLHLGLNDNEGLKAAEFYKISTNEKGLIFSSILSNLEEISKENLQLVESTLNKENTDNFLKEKGLFIEDEIVYKVNLLKALNEDLILKEYIFERKHLLSDFIDNKRKLKF
jgi:hypothetical protein